MTRRTEASQIALALVCLLGLFLLGGCGKREAAPNARVLQVSQRNEPADLDPARAGLPDDFFVIRALGEGLLVPSPDGAAPRPGAAERYEVSSDGQTYTFHLRADGRWSNGEPITASDFVASYRRLLTPATAAPKADLFFAVKNAREFAAGTVTDFATVGIRAVDSRTLAVTLVRPNPRFPLYVASGPWIPTNPRVVAQFGREWTQPAHYVGNGPFTLEEWRSQQRIVVRKNPLFHDTGHVALDAIEFIRFDDEDSEERAFRTGQIDVTMAVPRTKLPGYRHSHPDELRSTPLAETRFISFNVHRPPLDDRRVRQALALALDRRKLVERVVLGGQEPAARFVPPALVPPASPQTAPSPEQSFAPDRARELLAAAGFAGGRDFPRLELTAWSPSQTPVLEAIQAMWHDELGVQVTIAVREAKVHLAALRTGSYDLAFATTLLDVLDPLSLAEDFAPGAPGNFPHWRDLEYDQDLTRAAAAPDIAVQTVALVRAEDRLLAEAPVSPVYFNVRNYLCAPRVHGWQEDALWTRFYLNLTVDEK